MSIQYRLFKAKFFRKFQPLFVSWIITDKCNLNCACCDRNRGVTGHTKEEIIDRVVHEARASSIWRISLTGGEPLLHPGIDDIFRRLKEAGTSVSINTNALLAERKIDVLKQAAGVGVSLDGNEETNDSIRGPGAFKRTCQALETFSANGIPTKITCAITDRMSPEDAESVLEIAKRYEAPVVFQPSRYVVLYGDGPNPESPDRKSYGAVINHVVNLKRSYPSLVFNSMSGLRHLSKWPDDTPIACSAGRVSCRIEPNGDILACSMQTGEQPVGNILRDSLAEVFNTSPMPDCTRCWSGERVEANLMYTLKPGPILNYLRAGRSRNKQGRSIKNAVDTDNRNQSSAAN